MSRTARLTLLLTSSITGLTVWGVHFLQTSERDAMYQGVIRDEERIKVRLAQLAREAEFEEQKLDENILKIFNRSPIQPDLNLRNLN
ncbi:hypothetical protein KEM48_000467 [Puccinia striiformis f. sp. tritici PST-130]|nr:hypothetical protein KEM48_000467 [Puccinia striiformis f. sp. tritici PST-130]